MSHSRLAAWLLAASLLGGCAWTNVREGAPEEAAHPPHMTYHRVMVIAKAKSPQLGRELEQAFADRLGLAGVYAMAGEPSTLTPGRVGFHKLALAKFDAVLVLTPTTELASANADTGLKVELRSTSDNHVAWRGSAETSRWVQGASSDDEATTARSQADALVQAMAKDKVIGFKLDALTN